MFTDANGLVHGICSGWSPVMPHCGTVYVETVERYDGRMLTCVACFAYAMARR